MNSLISLIQDEYYILMSIPMDFWLGLIILGAFVWLVSLFAKTVFKIAVSVGLVMILASLAMNIVAGLT